MRSAGETAAARLRALLICVAVVCCMGQSCGTFPPVPVYEEEVLAEHPDAPPDGANDPAAPAAPELAIVSGVSPDGWSVDFAVTTLDGQPLPAATFTWDFGDGSSSEGSSVSHTYTKAGIYAVSVSAVIGAGITAYVLRTETGQVVPGAPVVAAGVLAVAPDGDYLTSARKGRPLDPPVVYTLTNTGGTPLTWTAAAGQVSEASVGISVPADALVFEPGSGTLAAGASVQVGVTVDVDALAARGPGEYVAVVDFVDTTPVEAAARSRTASPRTIKVRVPPPDTLRIAGHVRRQGLGLVGVHVCTDGGVCGDTNSEGAYELLVPVGPGGFAGTVTPTLGMETFTPRQLDYQSQPLVADVSSADFTAATPLNWPPTVYPLDLVGVQGKPLLITLTGESYNPGQDYTFQIETAPAHGSVPLFVAAPQPSATLTYVPTPGTSYSGPDLFTYRMSDGRAESLSPADVRLTLLRLQLSPAGGQVTTSQSVQFTMMSGTGPAALPQGTKLRWDFGDGTVLEGPETARTYAYASPGTYTVRVSTVPPDGQTAVSFDPVSVTVTGSTGGGDSIVLVPGPGWNGETVVSQYVGFDISLSEDRRPAGWDAKAIARWDVVPYQTFTGDFNVGVVAFHMNGIEKVSFSVNGGPWTDVREMTVNPQTANNSGIGVQTDGIVEYWATLRANTFKKTDGTLYDGPVEVRAIAWPTIGAPRVLQGLVNPSVPDGVMSMILHANGGGTLTGRTVYVANSGSDTNVGTLDSPKQNIAAAFGAAGDGGTVVILEPGTYTVQSLWGPAHQRFVTIRSADSVQVGDIVITGSEGRIINNARRVKWQTVTFDDAVDRYDVNSYHTKGQELVWFDDVRFTSTAPPDPVTGKVANGGITNNQKAAYLTRCTRDRGYNGFLQVQFVLNCEVSGLQEDAYTNANFVLNSTAHDITIFKGVHSDIYQCWGGKENVIVYGLRSWNCRDSQGILLGGEYTDAGEHATLDCAFVNITLDMASGAPRTIPVVSQMSQSHRHTFFGNVEWLGQGIIFRTDDSTWAARNVLFRDCRVPQYYLDRHGDPLSRLGWPLPAGVTWENVTASD